MVKIKPYLWDEGVLVFKLTIYYVAYTFLVNIYNS